MSDADKFTNEIDASSISRPERIILPDVSGISVPILAESGDGPAGRWALYLRWKNGTRRRLELPRYLDLPNRRRLWFNPQPGEPTTQTVQSLGGWSPDARKRWLKTGESPKPSKMFRRLCDRIDAFLDLPPAHARGVIATLALWIILTYNHLAWDAVPYLFIGGPYGSGKTRLFEILMRLAFRPFMSSSLTGPALFRTLHERGGVLLFDEAERLKETNAPEVGEIRSMLLAGYKRGGHATRMEASGDSFRTVSFDVYGPKAIACIEGPPPALASRCIRTMMFRAAPDSMKPRRRIDADPAIWQALRDDLHAVAINHGRVWLRLAGRSKVCPEMSGRDYELWQPLLAIAAWIEDDGEDGLLQVVQQHALATIEAGREEQIPHADEILIRILASLIRNGSCPTCGEILAIAKQQEPEFFQRWTARKISSYLARYGLETVPTNGKHRYREVTVADLRKIQKNYGFDLEFGE